MRKFARSKGSQADDVKAAKVWMRPGIGSNHGGAGPAHRAPDPEQGRLLASVYRQRAEEGNAAELMLEKMRPHDPKPLPMSLLPISDVVHDYAGICFKGVSKTNPYRRNQDALVMEKDAATDCILLAVVDGHGEHGDRIALWVARELPLRLFGHPLWADDPLLAFDDVIGCMAAFLGDPARAAVIFMDTEVCCGSPRHLPRIDGGRKQIEKA